jgi:phage shock protein E
MDWQTVIIAVAIVVAFIVFKRLRFVGVEKARQLLQQGALVVDVRTASEFRSGALKGAINAPLDTLAESVQRAAPDKSRPLLVHCLSGGRSEIAKVQLRRGGYQQVHNLGSLGRARRIVEG